MSFTVVLNGQPRSFTTLSQSPNLDQLVAELGLKSDRVAVEHNGAIVPRASWTETVLSAGDRLEVVHFVGGGCDAIGSVAIRAVSSDSHRSP
jgi:sulfur carrier protein